LDNQAVVIGHTKEGRKSKLSDQSGPDVLVETKISPNLDANRLKEREIKKKVEFPKRLSNAKSVPGQGPYRSISPADALPLA
jgi:hypothetical protein